MLGELGFNGSAEGASSLLIVELVQEIDPSMPTHLRLWFDLLLQHGALHVCASLSAIYHR